LITERSGHIHAVLHDATQDATHDATHDAKPHPVARLASAWLAAYVVLVAAMVGAGHVVAGGALGDWDRAGVNRWFVHQRTGVLDAATAVGSHLAETITVVGVGLVVVGILVWRRNGPAAALLVFGLALEVTVFLTATLLVDRGRPPIDQLDAAPPTSSFPSGHTAASVVLYGGLAIIAAASIHRRVLRAATTVALMTIPLLVGLARLYRGMHHPSDVIAGLLLGAACLTVATVAVRRSADAFALRRRAAAPRDHDLETLEMTS
jgi:undecaprenyl-diphosphatase